MKCTAHIRMAAIGMAVAALLPLQGLAEVPSLAFTSVPPLGSTSNLEGTAGNVVYSNVGVVVYVYVNSWWTKPTFDTPVTPVDSNGNWVCDITTGGADTGATAIAAFLVPAAWSPPTATGAAYLAESLYTNALARAEVYRPEILFSGYRWGVKDSLGGIFGPGSNTFSSSTNNVFVDAEGQLHLRMTRRDSKWQCSEIFSADTFGYGTYRVFLDSRVDNLDTNLVLGLFTWDDDPAENHRELDVEVSRWGDPADTDCSQFVVQPWDSGGHRLRYLLPAGLTNTTHGFRWQTNRVDFASYAGRYEIPPATNAVIREWAFTAAGVPATGRERFRMNLWLCAAEPAVSNDAEVVISRFVFVPEVILPPRLTNARWSADQFGFDFGTTQQLAYRIQSTPDLTAGWRTQSTVTATGTLWSAFDPDSSTQAVQFYRVVVPPQ